MTDLYKSPPTSLTETAPVSRPLVGREPEILEKRIGRMPLKKIVANYAQLKAASLINALSRRAMAAPATTILIGVGGGLLAGALIRLSLRSRVTNRSDAG